VWSAVLAECVHREVLNGLHTDDRGLKSKHLGALRGLNCPAVLVESAFLSSDSEGGRVAQPAFRQLIAQSLASGVASYVRCIERLKPSFRSSSITKPEVQRLTPTRP